MEDRFKDYTIELAGSVCQRAGEAQYEVKLELTFTIKSPEARLKYSMLLKLLRLPAMAKEEHRKMMLGVIE